MDSFAKRMTLSIAADKAHFFGIIFGLFIYGMLLSIDHMPWRCTDVICAGIYFSVFVITIHVLTCRETKSRVVTTALLALFVLSTSYYGQSRKTTPRGSASDGTRHTVLATYDIYLAFVPMRDNPGTIYHLDDWSDIICPIKE